MPGRQLPLRPSLEQYKKQAKDLVKAHRSEHPGAGQAKSPFTLADAQFTIAREHGFESWPKFAKHIKELSGRLPSASVWKTAEEAIVAGDVMTLEALLHAYPDVFQQERPQSWWHNTLTPDYQAADAQTIIASTHKFDTWHEFVAHQMATRDHNSEIARFEAAVDMVIRGDIVSLTKALSNHTDLVSVRSKRKHHSMLLHYVGANGVEGFRQHTPANAVAITELLLDRGADVNAIADMYGGATILGLAATSLHPKRAGVQQPLIQLLIDRGATFDDPGGQGHSLVRGCLANGRPEAAEYLATRGAPLDLTGAAGIGRLDVVRAFFANDSETKPSVAEMETAMLLAAGYGRTAVAVYLLDRGVNVDAEADGFTGVNAAATAGHLDTVRMFIGRGASLEKKNKYGGNALGGALWGVSNRPPDATADAYISVMELLVHSGAIVPPSFVRWWESVDEPSPRAHGSILALLRSHARELEGP